MRRSSKSLALVFTCLAFALAACDDASGGSSGDGGIVGDGGDGGGGGDGGATHSTNLSSAEVSAVVAAHNAARAAVVPAASPAIPNVAWSDTLANDAATWASQCKFSHSGNGHGENIYASTGGSSASAVVADWVSESTDYDYATNTCSAVCGHYTQVVWRNTSSIGCAKQTCTTGSPFGAGYPTWELWVCDYDPPGNYNGQKPY